MVSLALSLAFLSFLASVISDICLFCLLLHHFWFFFVCTRIAIDTG
jgi:hypothetical protein